MATLPYVSPTGLIRHIIFRERITKVFDGEKTDKVMKVHRAGTLDSTKGVASPFNVQRLPLGDRGLRAQLAGLKAQHKALGREIKKIESQLGRSKMKSQPSRSKPKQHRDRELLTHRTKRVYDAWLPQSKSGEIYTYRTLQSVLRRMNLNLSHHQLYNAVGELRRAGFVKQCGFNPQDRKMGSATKQFQLKL